MVLEVDNKEDEEAQTPQISIRRAPLREVIKKAGISRSG